MTERKHPLSVPALYAGIVLAGAQIVFYFQVMAPHITFPADLLMWGETEFVGNIIRLRSGQPLYSPVGDLNSSVYPPLASIVTYGITRLLQFPVTIPTLRWIQIGYVVLAVVMAWHAWRMLRRLLLPDATLSRPVVWSVLVTLTLFLIATAPGTAQWVHALHTDAFILLWSVATFCALIWYFARPSTARLFILALAPAIGFAIKQYALIWAPLIFISLLIDDYRQIRRLLQLVGLTTALTGAVTLTYYLLWGNDYLFWVFEVVGGERSRIGFSAEGYELSVPRAVDHALRAWGPLGLGFIGGWLLMTRKPSRRGLALWLPWPLLIASEAATSGTGWDALYHFGPGAVIGGVWLLVMLPEVWPETSPSVRLPALARSAWGGLAIGALFLSLGTMPSGDQGKERYWNTTAPSPAFAKAIEAELQGFDPSDILLDWGNWTYLPSNYLARFRAGAMFELPTAGRYDVLEPLVNRIRAREYKKVVVHRYHLTAFSYDWGRLDRPTGIRAALMENYDEVRIIEGLNPARLGSVIQYRGPVSVLVPKQYITDRAR